MKRFKETETTVIGQAIANLLKNPHSAVLLKSKSKRNIKKLEKSVKFCDVSQFIVYRADSLQFGEIWKGYLLTEHQFKNFVDVFVASVDLQELSDLILSRKFWHEVMAKGYPSLLSLSNVDSQLNHISLLHDYVGGVVTHIPDVELKGIDQEKSNNVYNKAIRKKAISMTRREKAKKLNDLKGLRQIQSFFVTNFNSEQFDEDFLVTLLDIALLKIKELNPFFEILKFDAFKKIFIRFAIVKAQIENFVTQKFNSLLRKVFCCEILNKPDDPEFYSQGIQVLKTMLNALESVSSLMLKIDKDFESDLMKERIDEGLGLFPLTMIGKFVVETSETTCVDLFTGSEFNKIAEGKLELTNLKLQINIPKNDEFPQSGDIYDTPIVILPSIFSNLANFFLEPIKMWHFYRDQWMILNLDLVNSGVINACLNDNVTLLKFFEDFEISKIISKNSIGYKNSKFQKTFINLANSSNEIHRYSVFLNPIVRGDLRFSTNHNCEFNCKGHRNYLLRITLVLNNFNVFYYLLDRGLSTDSYLCTDVPEKIYWGYLPPDEANDSVLKNFKIKQYTKYRKTKFVNIVLKNLFNTINVKNEQDLLNFEEKLLIFEYLKVQENDIVLDQMILFQIYYKLYQAIAKRLSLKQFSFHQLEKLNLKLINQSDASYQYYSIYYMVSIINQSKFYISSIILNLLKFQKYKLLLTYQMSLKQASIVFTILLCQLTNETAHHRLLLDNLSFLLKHFKISKNLIYNLSHILLSLHFNILLSNQINLLCILPHIVRVLSEDIELFTKLYVKLFPFDLKLLHSEFDAIVGTEQQTEIIAQILDIYFKKNCFYFSHSLLNALEKVKGFQQDLLNDLFITLLNKKVLTLHELKVVHELSVDYADLLPFSVKLYEKFIVKLLLLPCFHFEKLCLVGVTSTRPLFSDLTILKVLTETVTTLFGNKLDSEESKRVFVRIIKVLRKIAKRNKREDIWYEGIVYFIERCNLILDLETEYNDPKSVIPRITRYFNRKKKWEIHFDATNKVFFLSLAL